ncbi:MAG: hypothetical protein Q4E50_00420 [Tissierellia bacterium]|nr:hypothetical protein [Tissierellia bacterium]
MKKSRIKYFLLSTLILSIILLSSCSRRNSKDYTSEEKGLLTVKKPVTHNDIMGKWQLETSFKIEKEEADYKNTREKDQESEIFISNSAFLYKNVNIINPTMTARYINLQDYMDSKSLEKPRGLKTEGVNVVVYKFQDDKILSQDLIQLPDDSILIFQKNEVELYKKYDSISKEEEKKTYSKLKDALNVTENNPANLEYSLSLGVRRNNYSKTGESLDYDYMTYFIAKDKQMNRPRVLAVDDIVFSKDSVLWTVSHDRNYTPDNQPLIVDKISVNPTFRDESSKINFIEETIARRIDYINDNYIAFTNKNQISANKFEYYEIHSLNQLAKNKPLTVNNIGGPKAVEIFNSAFSDTLHSVANQSSNILDYKIDQSNIGLVRNRMSWDFISNFQATISETGRTVYRSIPLRIAPILDIGSYDNKNISWRDVLNRVPFATNAVVSPDGKMIIIQTVKQISIYSIYNNFISLKPQLTISNVSDTEIIMSKWYASDGIRPIYEDYLKLPRTGIQVNY